MYRKHQLGLTDHNREKSFPGFTLFTPLGQATAYLIDMDGSVVHRWQLPVHPGEWAYLLPNGNLLYGGYTDRSPVPFGGIGGLIAEIDWAGRVVWEYRDGTLHHDFSRMDNGNTMVLGWELIPPAMTSAIQGGVPGSELDGRMWSDYLREVDPAGNAVWEWHAYEALDVDEDIICPFENRTEWTHANACAVLADGNILISFRKLNTIAIIDRQTGKFAWKYRDIELGHQHDPTPLENGNVLVFANGMHIPRNPRSQVLEIDPRRNEVVWQYSTRPGWEFFSSFISGAERLPNGNTLICEGTTGRLFEVTVDGEVVWEYVNPFFGEHRRHGWVNSIFRTRRYPPDFRGLQGKDLAPER